MLSGFSPIPPSQTSVYSLVDKQKIKLYIRIDEYSCGQAMRQLTSLYKALADETRLRILSLLRRQELCVCDLVAALGLTQSRVSRHLAYLKNSGWVTDRRQGLWMFYSLAAPVNAVQRKLAESVVHLSKSLPACRQDAERLKRLLAQGACVASLKGRKKIAGRRRKRTS